MQRLIHAMAALGAALVFGCGQPPEDGQDDLGVARQAISNCQFMGDAADANNYSAGAHCYTSTAAQPYNCLLPSFYGRNTPVLWGFAPPVDNGTCPGSTNFPSLSPMQASAQIQAGFDAWTPGTGISFQKTTSLPIADIIVTCATGPAQPTSDGVAADTTLSGDVIFPGSSNETPVKWSSGPHGPITQPPNTTEPNLIRLSSKSVIAFHDLTIARIINAAGGTAAQKQAKVLGSMKGLAAHEVGHVLGFGDYQVLGDVMRFDFDLLSPPPVRIPLAFSDSARITHQEFFDAPAYPDHTFCDVGQPMLAVLPGHTRQEEYAAMVRDAYESGAWDSSGNGGQVHGPKLNPNGTFTPSVPLAVGTLSVPPTDYGVTPGIGSRVAFTDNMTFGIQTGPSHLSCNWSSTSQQCTFPHTYVFDWCFKSGITDAQFKSDFRTYTGLNAAQGSWDIPNDYGFAVYRFHNSCNDAGVNLVVDNGACSGTNSANIDGYVCLDMPTLTVPETISNNSGFTAPGTYYDWQKQPFANTWMGLHIDAADIAARVGAPGDRTDLFKHAVHIGLLWVRGIGSRTDITNLMSSRAVLPYAKNPRIVHQPETNIQSTAHMSQGEFCRGYMHSYPSSLLIGYPRGTTLLSYYCGAD